MFVASWQSVSASLIVLCPSLSLYSCYYDSLADGQGVAGVCQTAPSLRGKKQREGCRRRCVWWGGGWGGYKYTYTAWWCHLKWHHPMEGSQGTWWVSILQWVKGRELEGDSEREREREGACKIREGGKKWTGHGRDKDCDRGFHSLFSTWLLLVLAIFAEPHFCLSGILPLFSICWCCRPEGSMHECS